MSDFGFWLMIIILTTLCAGDPDLLGALVGLVMKMGACS
jgi:hypothetical protein